MGYQDAAGSFGLSLTDCMLLQNCFSIGKLEFGTEVCFQATNDKPALLAFKMRCKEIRLLDKLSVFRRCQAMWNGLSLSKS